ncbi:hypothetical protein Y032_0043g901 [Ancylostoma ceylanicum]|nr:hypothetical protein Y032_0043g901 [Ancylostoma ceylanicum]
MTTSNRGIPVMEVVEDVEAWLAKEKLSPEEGVAMLEERYKKYKYVEASMTSQKTRSESSFPSSARVVFRVFVCLCMCMGARTHIHTM